MTVSPHASPCPFCGATDPAIYVDDDDPNFTMRFVECPNCAARGPWTSKDDIRAWVLWNSRTVDTTPTTDTANDSHPL